MKKYLVTLRLHEIEVNLGLVEVSSIEHVAEKIGVCLNPPNDYDSTTFTYNLGPKHPHTSPDGAGVVNFHEIEEITSVAQFDELVSQKRRLEKSIAEAMS